MVSGKRGLPQGVRTALEKLFPNRFRGRLEDLKKLGIEPKHRLSNAERRELNGRLFEAASNSHFAEVKKLVEGGANVNARNSAGATPLHLAAGRGNLDLVKYLVSKGADVNSTDKGLFMPLHRAASEGRLDVIEYLVSNGADVFARTCNQHTALEVTRFPYVQQYLRKIMGKQNRGFGLGFE